MDEETSPSVERSFETPLRQRGLSTGKRCFLLGVPSWKKTLSQIHVVAIHKTFYGSLRYNNRYSHGGHPYPHCVIIRELDYAKECMQAN